MTTKDKVARLNLSLLEQATDMNNVIIEEMLKTNT
tara:strand:- start:5589 stop:5693 length:105 start_codon:yes stop_codon:yes gene_type:complete